MYIDGVTLAALLRNVYPMNNYWSSPGTSLNNNKRIIAVYLADNYELNKVLASHLEVWRKSNGTFSFLCSSIMPLSIRYEIYHLALAKLKIKAASGKRQVGR